MADAPRVLNIGGKSAAWLRQVGLRTWDDVAAIGAVDAYLRVKRAGFKPSLNLLYALEGALIGCHWQQVDPDRRAQLVAEAQAGAALLPSAKRTPAASDVIVTMGDAHEAQDEADAPDALSF